MPLNEFQITNFKAFSNPDPIPIRPITLIFGPNSSGKSSIIQALLLLKQTLQDENPNAVLSPKGNEVDLGSFYEFVHCHDVERSVSFKISVPTNVYGIEPLALKINFSFDKVTRQIRCSSLEIFVGNVSDALITFTPKVETSEISLKEPDDKSLNQSELIFIVSSIKSEHIFWKVISEMKFNTERTVYRDALVNENGKSVRKREEETIKPISISELKDLVLAYIQKDIVDSQKELIDALDFIDSPSSKVSKKSIWYFSIIKNLKEENFEKLDAILKPIAIKLKDIVKAKDAFLHSDKNRQELDSLVDKVQSKIKDGLNALDTLNDRERTYLIKFHPLGKFINKSKELSRLYNTQDQLTNCTIKQFIIQEFMNDAFHIKVSHFLPVEQFPPPPPSVEDRATMADDFFPDLVLFSDIQNVLKKYCREYISDDSNLPDFANLTELGEILSSFLPSKLALDAGKLIQEELSKIIYIGPLRQQPERYYIHRGNKVEQVGKSGTLAADLLLQDEEMLKQTNEFIEKINCPVASYGVLNKSS